MENLKVEGVPVIKEVKKVKRIKSLTKEQKDQVKYWVEKWIKIGLCTEPSDRPAAEKAIRKCYELSKKVPPKTFIWVDSPIMVAVIGPSMDYLYNLVRETPEGSKIKVDGLKLNENIQKKWSKYIGGQFWIHWQAYESFLREVCGLEHDKIPEAIAFQEAQTSCCWWWPHTEFCVVCDRPKAIFRDDNGRLHNPNGKAIEFRDGWGKYLWHGVTVPGDIIENHSNLTVKRIEDETNAEVRRCMIELYGQAKYIQDSGAKEIHKDEFGTLYQKELPGDEPMVMVKVVNSTPEPDGSFKDYFIRVNPQLRPMLSNGQMGEAQEMTALNAVASTFGKTGKEYLLSVET